MAGQCGAVSGDRRLIAKVARRIGRPLKMKALAITLLIIGCRHSAVHWPVEHPATSFGQFGVILIPKLSLQAQLT